MAASRCTVYSAAVFGAYAIATCTTFIRVFTRGYLLRQFGVDDCLVVAGSIAETISMPFYHYSMKYAGQLISEHSSGGTMSNALRTVLHDDPKLNKHMYAICILYLIAFGLIKLGILGFLLRFLQPGHLRRAAYLVALGICLFTIVGVLVSAFRCQPIYKAWTQAAPEGRCAMGSIVMHTAYSAFHLVTDIIILLLPMPMVLKLHASARRKAGLVIIFSIGLIGTVETIRRLAAAIDALCHPQSEEIRVIELPFRSHMEINFVTVCANLPAFASLWNYMRRRRQESKATSMGQSDRMSPVPLRRDFIQDKVTVSSSATVVAGFEDLEKWSTTDKERVSLSQGDILRSTKLEVSVD